MNAVTKDQVDLILKANCSGFKVRSRHPDLIGKLETLDDAEHDAELMVAAFADIGGVDGLDSAAERLIDCRSKARCGSAACGVCVRHVLIYLDRKCQLLNAANPVMAAATVRFIGALAFDSGDNDDNTVPASTARMMARYLVLLNEVGIHSLLRLENAKIVCQDRKVELIRTDD